MLFSLIVPVYNESTYLNNNIPRLIGILKRMKCSYELILIDDCSTDSSFLIMKELKYIYPKIILLRNKKNMGKGYCINKAFKFAKGKWLAFIDADLDIDPKSLYFLIKYFNKKYDLIIGSKHHKNSIVVYPLLRSFLSLVYNILSRYFLSVPVSDFQCGLKAIHRDVYKKLIPYFTFFRWSWDTELLLYSHYFKYKIKEIPVKCQLSKSSFRIFSDSFRMGIDLLRLFFSYRSIKYFGDKANYYIKNRKNGILSVFVTSEATGVVKSIKPSKGMKILDFGCGSGYYGFILSQYGISYKGVDNSPLMARVARKNGFLVDIDSIENYVSDQKYDVVLISGALEFCLNKSKVIKNAFSSLKENGKIVIIYPRKNIFGLFYFLYHFSHGVRISLSRASFLKYVKDISNNNLLSTTYVLKKNN